MGREAAVSAGYGGRRVGPALALSVCLLALPVTAAAQSERPLRLSVSEETGQLDMAVRGLFRDSELTQALHSGLPMRIQIVAELWKDGFLDSQHGRGDWRASVIFDPLEARYRVAAGVFGTAETVVDALPDVEEVLEEFFDIAVRPQESGRYYYEVQVGVETLSLSDLEELQRWLRGELGPADADVEDDAGAGRSLRRLVVRALGLPARRYQVRSPPFDIVVRGPG